jgi:hypothetical protein
LKLKKTQSDLYRLALAHGHRYWKWLFRLAPQDFAQCAALAALQSAGLDTIGKSASREFRELSRELGYVGPYRVKLERPLPKNERGVRHGRMIWRTHTNGRRQVSVVGKLSA